MNFSLYGLLVGLATALVWIAVEKILKTSPVAKKWPESVWNFGLLSLLISTAIGARVYHLATDWQLYEADPWPAVIQVWNGGLGWYGGVVGAIIGIAVWRTLQSPKAPWFLLLDSFALAVPWGQSLGRWGNYFNQELFGPPTQLPWGIYIEPVLRPIMWKDSATFHPLFLYESLGSLLLGAGLFSLWKWNKRTKQAWPTLGSGAFFALYSLGFGIMRFSLDFLRYDLNPTALGLTVSQWFSLAFIALSLVLLQISFRQWARSLFLLCLLTIGSLGFILSASTAHAQSSAIDLTVVPSVVDITIQPGKSVTRAFTVKNSGTANLRAKTEIYEFGSDGRTGSPVITGQSEFPYASFANTEIALGQTFLLPAGKEQQLVLSLNIPEDAQERDWYLVLLTQTESTEVTPALTSRASSQGAIGATLLIKVSRTESIPLQWGLSFPKLPKVFDSLRPLTIEPHVDNLNPSMAVPHLSISVRDWRGKQVVSQEGLPERVLARSSRIIRAQKPSVEDPRSMEPTPFVYDPAFAFGKYTVEGRIANQAGDTLVVQQEVWALPLSLIVVVLGAGLASVLAKILRIRKARSGR